MSDVAPETPVDQPVEAPAVETPVVESPVDPAPPMETPVAPDPVETFHEEFPDEPLTPPVDAAEDVSAGDTVTVTLPRAAAEVLAFPEGRKLAEIGDAQVLLRAQL